MRIAGPLCGVVGGVLLLAVAVLGTGGFTALGLALAMAALVGAGLALRHPVAGGLLLVGASVAIILLLGLASITVIAAALVLLGGCLALYRPDDPSRDPSRRREAGIDLGVERWATRTLGAVTALALLAMMLLTFADVWGRYLLRQPVFGGYEVTEFLMGILIFSGLPILCAREGHVAIDVFDTLIPRKWRRPQMVAANLVSAVALGIIAWRLFLLGEELWRNKEVTMTLKIPHGPFAIVFGVLAAAACIASLAVFWSYLRGTRDPIEGEAAS